LTLRIVWLLSRITLAELIYQAFEFQQIRHAEERTILAYDDLRIGSNDIRPLRRNRADRDIIDPEQETSSVTVVSLAHATTSLPLSGWNGCVMRTRRIAETEAPALWVELQAVGAATVSSGRKPNERYR